MGIKQPGFNGKSEVLFFFRGSIEIGVKKKGLLLLLD